MKPQTIGRALGIGLRVAGRIAGQRIAAGAQSAETAPAPQAVDGGQTRAKAAGQTAMSGRAAALTAKGVARGVGGFLAPFRRVGGILWLEVTGAFFFLFGVFSASFLWKYRASYAHGPDHGRFLAAAGMMAVFLYLGVSSFWRVRKK